MEFGRQGRGGPSRCAFVGSRMLFEIGRRGTAKDERRRGAGWAAINIWLFRNELEEARWDGPADARRPKGVLSYEDP